MAIYKFRVILEDEDNVYRDIEIKSNFSLWEFHQAIKKSFILEDEPEAEFFLSDNNWHELDAIANIPEGQINLRTLPLLNKSVTTLVNDPHQRFIYKLKTYRNFTFFIELVKIGADDPKANYPRTVKILGEPPRPVKPSLEPPPVEGEDFELPKRKGKSGFAPILIPGDLDAEEPDATDLESEEISGIIDDANLLEDIDFEGMETMVAGEESSPTKAFDDESIFGDDDEDDNKDMGDFDFDSFSGGGEDY
jgi:hypothetical protein